MHPFYYYFDLNLSIAVAVKNLCQIRTLTKPTKYVQESNKTWTSYKPLNIKIGTSKKQTKLLYAKLNKSNFPWMYEKEPQNASFSLLCKRNKWKVTIQLCHSPLVIRPVKGCIKQCPPPPQPHHPPNPPSE